MVAKGAQAGRRVAALAWLAVGLAACSTGAADRDVAVVAPAAGGVGTATVPDPTVVSPLGYDVGVPSTWWSALPPDPRGAVTGAFVGWDGRRVLSIGGRTAAGREAGAAAFDPVAGTWSKLADPPSSVVAAIAVDPVGWSTGPVSFDIGGRVLFLGGEGDEGAIAWWFDPAADTWAEAPSPPAPVTAATPTVWTGRVLLAWLPATDPGGAVAVFDPATARWSTPAAPAPIRYREGGVSAWTGSRWLVWGGQAADGTTYGDGASYDPVKAGGRRSRPGRCRPGGRRAPGPAATWSSSAAQSASGAR